MDVAELVISSQSGGVEILVNGLRLEELARVAELPAATADGQPHLAGTYEPLWAHYLGSDIRPHFMGSPALTWFEDGDTVLLGCDCGEWGCWPLTADIALGEHEVTWSHFRQGHRDWDLTALGPFLFDRSQYEAALRAADL